MKIWDIYDHLQLVSSIFIKTSSNKSILKKQVKPGFTNYLPRGLVKKNLNQKFWKFQEFWKKNLKQKKTNFKNSRKIRNKNGGKLKFLKILLKILNIVIFTNLQNEEEEKIPKNTRTEVSMTQNP